MLPSKRKRAAATAGPSHSDSEIEEIEPPAGPQSEDEPARTNGRATAKGRGKGKAATKEKPDVKVKAEKPGPASKTAKGKGKAREDAMEVDGEDILVLQEEEEEPEVQQPPPPPNEVKKRRPAARVKGEEALRKMVAELQAHNDELSQQVQTLQDQRKREDQHQQDRAKLDQTRIETQQQMNAQLYTQIGHSSLLQTQGASSILGLLTREAAEKEQDVLKKDLERERQAARDKEQVVKDREARISELEQQVKELQFELKVEREQNKQGNRNPPPSAQRGAAAQGIGDPKAAVVLSFYEDLTNIIIPNVKPQAPQFLSEPEYDLHCVYTHAGTDEQAGTQNRTLEFVLRLTFSIAQGEERNEIRSREQLVQSVQYTPINLEKEQPDFVERLEYLNGIFTFQRDQLPLFLSTMQTKFKEYLEPEADESDDAIEVE